MNPGSRRVRFGLVGCGQIGATGDDRAKLWPGSHLWLPYSHAAAIAACPDADFRAVCDLRPEAAASTAKEFGVPATYADVRTMIESEDIEVLAIATRTAERLAIIEDGAARGVRGFYCEKPLANSLETADRIRTLIEASGIAFSFGVKRRFMPLHHEARLRVERGEIGELRAITVHLGNGLLLWTQPHAIDMACFYAHDAEIESVQADLDIPRDAVHGLTVDADPLLRMVSIRFATGVIATITPGASLDIEIAGTRGAVSVRNNGLVTCTRRAVDSSGYFLAEQCTPNGEPSSGTLIAVEMLARAIRDGADPGYRVSLAVRNLEILHACVLSHLDGGRRVQFPLGRCGLTVTGRYGNLLA